MKLTIHCSSGTAKLMRPLTLKIGRLPASQGEYSTLKDVYFLHFWSLITGTSSKRKTYIPWLLIYWWTFQCASILLPWSLKMLVLRILSLFMECNSGPPSTRPLSWDQPSDGSKILPWKRNGKILSVPAILWIKHYSNLNVFICNPFRHWAPKQD